MNKQIQIFKPGKHTAMSGAALSFSESDLIATAKAYDPKLHEAPLVIGHPQHDTPAYGWVGKMNFAEGGLEVEPIQVNQDFAEMVSNGAFKKISASFYAPDSPSNPVPGVYYLRHVGFLGAQPPAVKGLRNPSFGDAEQGVVSFADWDDVQNASLWRRLRDWMISEKGLAVADNIIPDYSVASLEQAAQQEDDDTSSTPIPQFSETSIKGEEMSVEDKARLAKLEAENKELLAKQVAFAEADKKTKADARHAGHVAFAEGLIKEGKLLPAHKEVTVAALNAIAGQEQVVEFGEGDKKQPLADALKAMLQAQPKLVNFAELSADKNQKSATASTAIPRGYEVDPERMEMHQSALEYAESHKCDYVTAVKAVEAGR